MKIMILNSKLYTTSWEYIYCSLFNKSESFTLSDKVALKNFKVVYFVRQYLELQLMNSCSDFKTSI